MSLNASTVAHANFSFLFEAGSADYPSGCLQHRVELPPNEIFLSGHSTGLHSIHLLQQSPEIEPMKKSHVKSPVAWTYAHARSVSASFVQPHANRCDKTYEPVCNA